MFEDAAKLVPVQDALIFGRRCKRQRESRAQPHTPVGCTEAIMQDYRQKHRSTPTRSDQHQRDRRSSPAANAYPNKNVAAGFLTARDTARNTERSERGAARHQRDLPPYQGFDSDMHTARGFETDEYLSAVEPSTSRTTGTLMEVHIACSLR